MIKILHRYWPLFTIIALSSLIVWPVFLPGYFSHHDDLQVMRIFEMRKCLKDFQIPCRWVPDMGYGNGFPLFNYYGVLPYYIGALLSYVLGFIGSAKALFFLSLFLGGISMYFLGEIIGGKWVGLTSSILFLFAPYRSLDTYVRGAVSETFALSIIPLVFYFLVRVSRKKNFFNFISLSLLFAAFLITHNIMTMLFVPLIILFLAYLKFAEKTKNIKVMIISLALGFGMSAFFLLPAFLEKDLVQTDNLVKFDLDYRVHFATIKQLFISRAWGYGASVLGPNDTISFQIGWPHWWLVVLALPIFLKKKKILGLGLILIFLFSIFMTHNRSAFVWEKLDILKYTQFPWRFLSIAIFSSSLIGGFILTLFNPRLQKYLTILIVLLTIVLNFNYFKPEEFYFNLTDQEKLSGSLWEEQTRAATLDYLPKDAYAPKEPASSLPIVKSGKAEVNQFVKRTDSFKFDAQVKSPSLIEMPIFDFPNWQVLVNGNKISHTNDNLLRRIQFNLGVGNIKVEGKLQDTPIRTLANLLTLVSLTGLIIMNYAKKI